MEEHRRWNKLVFVDKWNYKAYIHNVVNFYGSVTTKLLENSLTFSANCTKILELTKSTVLQATNSALCYDGRICVKKQSDIFDVTMGGFHCADICIK